MTVSVTSTCRDIDELTPLARKAIILFFYLCQKEKINIFVTETYRSQERQNYLYAQGRTRAGKPVTWTTNSLHKSRKAWDIGAAQVDGNTDIYNTAIIKKAGAVARKLGITWGGDWKNNLDYPHFQISDSWKVPTGYDLTNIVVSIPTTSKSYIQVVTKLSQLPKVPLTKEDPKEVKEMTTPTKLRDVGTTTLRTSAYTFVKNAYDAGIITSKEWVDAAESGDLTMDTLTLLKIHVELTGQSIGLSTSNSLKKDFIQMLMQALSDGIITDTKWIQQAESGKLTVIDALLLRNIIERRYKG